MVGFVFIPVQLIIAFVHLLITYFKLVATCFMLVYNHKFYLLFLFVSFPPSFSSQFLTRVLCPTVERLDLLFQSLSIIMLAVGCGDLTEPE